MQVNAKTFTNSCQFVVAKTIYQQLSFVGDTSLVPKTSSTLLALLVMAIMMSAYIVTNLVLIVGSDTYCCNGQ